MTQTEWAIFIAGMCSGGGAFMMGYGRVSATIAVVAIGLLGYIALA